MTALTNYMHLTHFRLRLQCKDHSLVPVTNGGTQWRGSSPYFSPTEQRRVVLRMGVLSPTLRHVLFDILGTPQCGWRIHASPTKIELETLTPAKHDEQLGGVQFHLEQVCELSHAFLGQDELVIGDEDWGG